MTDRRELKMPGHGIECGACGQVLTSVCRTTQSEGFTMRERRCEHCGKLNVTSERRITTRDVRKYFK